MTGPLAPYFDQLVPLPDDPDAARDPGCAQLVFIVRERTCGRVRTILMSTNFGLPRPAFLFLVTGLPTAEAGNVCTRDIVQMIVHLLRKYVQHDMSVVLPRSRIEQ